MGIKTGNPRGRPKGQKNKRTAEREEAMAEASRSIAATLPNAFEGDAHALLMAVYKDPSNDIDLRVDAAKAAIRYERPALANIESNVNVSNHEQAIDDLE